MAAADSLAAMPRHWARCGRMGDPIQQFIPFKTCIDQRFDALIAEEDRFPPSMFLKYQLAKKRKVALIVNLMDTSADAFYRADEFKDVSVVHLRHEQLDDPAPTPPSAEVVKTFCAIASRVLNRDARSFVGVHCAYGYNVTAFFIASYLVEVDGWSVAAALHAFAKARKPGLFNVTFARTLYERYDEDLPTDGFSTIPDAPWLQSTDSDMPDSNGDRSSSSGSIKRTLSDSSSTSSGSLTAAAKKARLTMNLPGPSDAPAEAVGSASFNKLIDTHPFLLGLSTSESERVLAVMSDVLKDIAPPDLGYAPVHALYQRILLSYRSISYRW